MVAKDRVKYFIYSFFNWFVLFTPSFLSKKKIEKEKTCNVTSKQKKRIPAVIFILQVTLFVPQSRFNTSSRKVQ